LFGRVEARAAEKGLIGVAGASCGGAESGRLVAGAIEARFPMLRMAGSTNAGGCAAEG
jgi:hypothetical protein